MNCINSISDTPERQDPTRYMDVIHWHVDSQDRNSKIFLAQWEKHKMMKKKILIWKLSKQLVAECGRL